MSPYFSVFNLCVECEYVKEKQEEACSVYNKCPCLLISVVGTIYNKGNLGILGAPIGDYLHCSKFTGKSAESRRLLSGLVDVALQV